MLAEKLRVFVTAQEKLDYVRLCGVIDEDNNLMGVIPRLARPVVVVALREVTRINSCGVRDWVNWISAVEAAGRRVILYECSPAVVSQINLVANFAGKAHVESFLAPYFCSSCDTERLRLVETGKLVGDRPRAPRALCDECDSLMALDEVEESFFAFVQRSQQPGSDPLVEQALAELTPTIDEKLLRIDYTPAGDKRARPSAPPAPAPPAPDGGRAARPAAKVVTRAPAPLPATSPPAALPSGEIPGWFWPLLAAVIAAGVVSALLLVWIK